MIVPAFVKVLRNVKKPALVKVPLLVREPDCNVKLPELLLMSVPLFTVVPAFKVVDPLFINCPPAVMVKGAKD